MNSCELNKHNGIDFETPRNKLSSMKKTYFILLVFALMFCNALKAQVAVYGNKPGWYRIAQKSVDFRSDQDQVEIVGADKFKAIQLKVTDARIHFEDLNVIYDLPGVTQEFKEDISVRSDFKPGDKTRIIYLKYPCLKINKIRFVYRTVPNFRYEKAHIEIYGLK